MSDQSRLLELQGASPAYIAYVAKVRGDEPERRPEDTVVTDDDGECD